MTCVISKHYIINIDLSGLLCIPRDTNDLGLHSLSDIVKADENLPNITCEGWPFDVAWYLSEINETMNDPYCVVCEIIASENCITRVIRETDLLASSVVSDVLYGSNKSFITKILKFLPQSTRIDDPRLSEFLIGLSSTFNITRAMINPCDDISKAINQYEERGEITKEYETEISNKIYLSMDISERQSSNSINLNMMKQISVPDNIKGDLTIKVLMGRRY